MLTKHMLLCALLCEVPGCCAHVFAREEGGLDGGRIRSILKVVFEVQHHVSPSRSPSEPAGISLEASNLKVDLNTTESFGQ